MRTPGPTPSLPVLALVLLALPAALGMPGCRGKLEDAGRVTATSVPPSAVRARAQRQAPVSPPGAKQILFGDLHVHTTFSVDAFVRTLPLMQGEGSHPPADACDFARFCSDLDFWSINDHAEAITPEHWLQTRESIRQCNAVAGDPSDPDLVSFLGWEWTQVGLTPAEHYGHKNVILLDQEEGRVPTRPIGARTGQLVEALLNPPPFWQRVQLPLLDFPNRQRYFDFAALQQAIRETPVCPEGVDVRELPEDCLESASTPAVLFEKLSQWGFPSLVIPHGTTWGFYTPPGTTLDKQLTPEQHDPSRQTLIEVFSGHGNSEEYRPWRAVDIAEDGTLSCPAPSEDYLPCCWRAGEIIRSRCEDPQSPACEERVARARQLYAEAGAAGHLTVPGATVEDWLDCGQCRDCFNPSFNYRPGNSVQYALAIRNFDAGDEPLGFRFGFLASSDNHSARPGTGYKEFARRAMTEAIGTRSEAWRRRLLDGLIREPSPEPVPLDQVKVPLPFLRLDVERQASFFMTGGLVAVHADGRDRQSIWDAMERREVYGTSGDRILLWFDLLNAPQGTVAMGGEAALAGAPRFRVRAAGAFEQLPGCPEHSVHALGAERLEYVCRNECYHPSDRRRRITRIEVVRIRPQIRPDEPVAPLIEDPWRTIACADEGAGCVVEFTDDELPAVPRETLYYVRAIQEPTPAVNADNLRCERDEAGNCIRVRPCHGDYRTPFDDDCLAPNEERAWSSPIVVHAAAKGVGAP